MHWSRRAALALWCAGVVAHTIFLCVHEPPTRAHMTLLISHLVQSVFFVSVLSLPALLVIDLFFGPRNRRRTPPGHCRCGYDLTGNTSGICPECGELILHSGLADHEEADRRTPSAQSRILP